MMTQQAADCGGQLRGQLQAPGQGTHLPQSLARLHEGQGLGVLRVCAGVV